MSDILSCAGSLASEFLVRLVGPHCGYVFFTDRKVRQLEGELEELVHTREMVAQDVEEARNNLKPIFPFVEKWLVLVDEQIVANKAPGVLDPNGRTQKTCFCGWLPNPKARYCLGKDASKTVEEIRNLIAQRNKWERVYYEDAPKGSVPVAPEGNSLAGGGGDDIQEHIAQGQSENAPPGRVGGAANLNSSAADGGDIITGSRASIIQDIMEALGNDELKVIGVYGPGGVGKTTLLKEVHEKLRKEKRPFHMIVKAEVSQTPDLNNIRDQIADDLGLDLRQKQSAQGRRDLLLKRLQKEPNEKILIILDNLLVELDLTAIGIPLGEESKGCKLLLTSRYNNVLEKMRADRTFHLKGLEDDEAVRLFEKTVGDRLKDEEELKPIAAQVATKLAGLPLLIISVATALKNSDVGAWRNALLRIDAEEMEVIVQLSYNHLKGDEIKSLFLLCGLIGGTIQVETLLVLGMGLGLFEKYKKTIQDSRDRLDTMLSKLRSACLLLDGGDDKENVTIHDLYSEVVVSTPFRDQNSLIIHDDYGAWPKKKLKECRACLVNVGNDRLVELMPRQFPHAKILMLSGKKGMGDRSRKYFKHMKELRALCLCSMSITSFPFPIENLRNLQSLIINCRLKDVAILGNLTALQILSFAGYTISRLPKKFGELTNLRSLNVGHTERLIIESGVLEGLINLKELHMKGRCHQWREKEDISSSWYGARLAESKSLTKLTSFEISIQDPTILLEDDDLTVGNLAIFFIEIGNERCSEFKGLDTLKIIGNVEGREFKGFNTMKLNLYGCRTILSRECVQIALQKTKHLHLTLLSEFNESVHELCTRGFQEPKHLHICNISSIKYIANSSNGLLLTAFTKLESLFLKNLINLKKILHGAIAPECFSKLKAVSIKNCSQLRNLWCISEIHRLVHLEEIEVWGCESMRALIIDDAGDNIAEADHIGELPNVHRLRLGMLPNMTSICTRAEITSKGTPIQRIWKQDVQLQGISRFQNLRELYVSYTGLQFLFPLSVAKCLAQIRDIQVENCLDMRAIIVDEEGRDEGTDDIIVFPLLKRLSIIHCPTEKFILYTHGKKESATTTSDSQEACSDSFFDLMVSLPCLEELVLRGAGPFKKIWHGELPRSSFCKLATLALQNCSNLLNIFPSMIIGRLHKLKRVSVLTCPSLESLFDCGSLDSNMEQKIASLPKLEEVIAVGAGSLRHMVKSNSQTVLGFPSLKSVKVSYCSELTHLFPKSTATTLAKLEKLIISNCEQMEEVVLKEERGRSKAEVITFPCLSELTLLSLKKLLSFNSGSCPYDFASLTKLCIRWCGNFGAFVSSHTNVEAPSSETAKEDDGSPQSLFNEMVTFPNLRELEITSVQCKELWTNQIPAHSFCKLESLKLENCGNLQRIAPSHLWKRLQQCLEVLDVRSCPLIEIIYEIDGTVTKSGKLRSLNLSFLERLRHIWRYDGLPNVPFPNLRSINVWSCPCLEIVFPTFTAEFLGQIQMLVVQYCKNLELIADHGECGEATDMTITFSRLTWLRLHDLPKFRGCLPEKYSVEFPPGAELHVRSCGTEPDQRG